MSGEVRPRESSVADSASLADELQVPGWEPTLFERNWTMSALSAVTMATLVPKLEHRNPVVVESAESGTYRLLGVEPSAKGRSSC